MNDISNLPQPSFTDERQFVRDYKRRDVLGGRKHSSVSDEDDGELQWSEDDDCDGLKRRDSTSYAAQVTSNVLSLVILTGVVLTLAIIMADPVQLEQQQGRLRKWAVGFNKWLDQPFWP